jgi:hypothetical protein
MNGTKGFHSEKEVIIRFNIRNGIFVEVMLKESRIAVFVSRE